MPNGDHYPRTGPDSFDCSGLVWWAYQQAGVDVGWTTVQQANSGQRIACGLDDLNGASTSCWAPGDIVLLQYRGGQHVALYTGSGLFMDCYNHATGCILHPIDGNSFYQAHFWQARRPVSGCEGQSIDPGLPSPSSPTGPVSSQ
jgi:cell wall-associated NlpC family hydrolase